MQYTLQDEICPRPTGWELGTKGTLGVEDANPFIIKEPLSLPSKDTTLFQKTPHIELEGGLLATELEKGYRRLEEVSPSYTLELQEEGGYVATSPEYPSAVGQGETIEEAIQDLKEAIELLKEELAEKPME